MKLVSSADDPPRDADSSVTQWLHVPFLERAADPNDSETGDLSLGAFLTLRLADQFRPALLGTHPGPVSFQASATRDFLAGLETSAPELPYLREIVRVASRALKAGSARPLWPPLLAYAGWLERQDRLAEGLDVLDTTLRLMGGDVFDEVVAAGLARGRVLRLLGRLPEAREAYAAAGAASAGRGDHHSVLLSRIGLAVVEQRHGRVVGAERLLAAVIVDAERTGDRDAEARARHDRACGFTQRRRWRRAIPDLWRAFELHEPGESRLRVAYELGRAMKQVGRVEAAEHAFQIMLTSDVPPEMRLDAVLELLELAILSNDRVTFERRRRELVALGGADFPPVAAVQLEVLTGVGLALFGQRRQGEERLRQAITMAKREDLAEGRAYAEKALDKMRSGGLVRSRRVRPDLEIERVSEGLRALVAGILPGA